MVEIVEGRLSVGGVPASDLAATYGTPLYAYSADAFRARWRRLVDGIPYRHLQVYYSCKANPAVAILRLVRGFGARLDVCSPGDVESGRAAGYSDNEMSYVGHAMSDEEINLVADSDVFF